MAINGIDAIWIATAVLATRATIGKRSSFKLDDVCFKAEEILNLAKEVTEEKIDIYTVLQDATAHMENSKANYLVDENGLRRVSFMGEFIGNKECPESSVIGEGRKYKKILNLDDSGITEVYEFMNREYTEQFRKRLKNKINYLSVMDYLENNAGMPYSNPEKKGLPAQEREKFLKLKENGQNAVKEIKKMIELCKSNFKLECNDPISWLDGSNKKIRNYLWAQLKYPEFAKRAESISIFVDISEKTNRARYCFNLEIKNNKSSKQDMDNYHKHLEIPIDLGSSLVYMAGSNESGSPVVLKEDREIIKDKIKKGIYKKVQISRVIERDDKLTDSEIEKYMIEGIRELIPFYEYIIGIKNNLYDENIENMENNIMVKEDSKEKEKYMGYDKNIILYGPPGTGKTYNTVIYAVAICDNKKIEDVEALPYDKVLERYNELRNQEGRISFTTFHQSYGYEEFIEGIKPKIDDNSTDIEYTIKDGIFKEFCNRAESGKNLYSIERENVQPYVFIIDEINRGNISKIFGELITLIEPTKRKGAAEETEAILPYSNSLFGVPENVYIIGTMNTADRSIALMDTALRRRFQFIEKMPDVEILRKIGADKIIDKGNELDVANMLECINKRIEYLFDREHTIGHAFFTCLKDEPTVSKLASIFKKSVIPLLQEYFYEDYSKIMLILGDNGKRINAHKFIIEKEIKINNIFRGDTSDIDIPEYSYQIQESAFEDIMSYIEITEE